MQTTKRTVTVEVTSSITFTEREAMFLRRMAQFCDVHHMPGGNACVRLDRALEAAGFPPYDHGPVHDLFEVPT